MTKDINRP